MKTLGIIGGMGPMATADLFMKIISLTKSGRDQDHIHIIIDNKPSIPDRTSFILGAGDNPEKDLIESAKMLEKSGAHFLAMACNTAHYFYDAIRKEVNIPFLSMVDETAKSIIGEKKVALMATKGTYKGEIYSKVFKTYGIDVFEPEDFIKDIINKIIYDYKAGRAIEQKEIDAIISYFDDNNIKKIILGCTELPIIFENYHNQSRLIDPSKILALAVTVYAKK